MSCSDGSLDVLTASLLSGGLVLVGTLQLLLHILLSSNCLVLAAWDQQHLVPAQATQQLSPAWTLMRGGTPGCPEIPDWLATNLPDAARVGIDPYLHTVRLVSRAPASCSYRSIMVAVLSTQAVSL